MTVAELEQRRQASEQTVLQLQSQVERSTSGRQRWWVEDAGRFADDPVFDEIVRLGRDYRESLRSKELVTSTPSVGNGQ